MYWPLDRVLPIAGKNDTSEEISSIRLLETTLDLMSRGSFQLPYKPDVKKTVKLKQPLYSPEQSLRVPGG